MIFFKKIRNDIKMAIGIGCSVKKKLGKFKRETRSEMSELENDMIGFTSYFVDGMVDIQNNMELLVNEINALKEKKVFKEKKRIDTVNNYEDFLSHGIPEMNKNFEKVKKSTKKRIRKVRSDKGVKRK